jgi:hypothetical protein
MLQLQRFYRGGHDSTAACASVRAQASQSKHGGFAFTERAQANASPMPNVTCTCNNIMPARYCVNNIYDLGFRAQANTSPMPNVTCTCNNIMPARYCINNIYDLGCGRA